MTDPTSKDYVLRIADELADMSNERTLEELGVSIKHTAIKCLNTALAKHGGAPIADDGQPHNMRRYISLDKHVAVLEDARLIAEERGIAVPQTYNIQSVITDDDAIGFVIGW